LLVAAGLGTAAAFAPAWDSYLLRTAAGQTESFTQGNAFSYPGWVIFGNVLVMIAFAAVVVVAALWRPLQLGAMLLAGAIIPMAAQAVSALVQVGEATSPAQFGISSAQATAAGLTISNGVTPAFWIYCVFVVVLVVSCVWMLITPPVAAPDQAAPYPGASYPGASYPGGSYPGGTYPDESRPTAQYATAHYATSQYTGPVPDPVWHAPSPAEPVTAPVRPSAEPTQPAAPASRATSDEYWDEAELAATDSPAEED
jgi:hypothetical protein